MGLRTIWDNLTPLIYVAVGVAFSETMRTLVVAFNQRLQDRRLYRKQQKDESASIQLRRIDDAAEWRRQQEMRLAAQDKELDEKDMRIDVLVEQNAQLHAEKIACERERDWYKERCVAVGQELNELKFKKRQDDT